MSSNGPADGWHSKMSSFAPFWTVTGPIALSFAAGQFLFADVYDVLGFGAILAAPIIAVVILGAAAWGLYLFLKARNERSALIGVSLSRLGERDQLILYFIISFTCAFALWAGMEVQSRTNSFEDAAQTETRRRQAIDVASTLVPLIISNCVPSTSAKPTDEEVPVEAQ